MSGAGGFILWSFPATLGHGDPHGHTHHQTDVIIVGLVGRTVHRLRMRHGAAVCHVVDVLADAGGQCTALYPEKPIYDVPGFRASRRPSWWCG